jgi:hypothetical protein
LRAELAASSVSYRAAVDNKLCFITKVFELGDSGREPEIAVEE